MAKQQHESCGRKEEKGEITEATESLPNVGPSESDVEVRTSIQR